MKGLLVVALILVGFSSLGADDPVRIMPTENGGLIAAVDVSGGPGRFRRAWTWVRENPWKVAGTAAAVITVDRVAYNNNWLWYESRRKSRSAGRDLSSSDSVTIDEGQQHVTVDVSGDHNTIVINLPSGPGNAGATGSQDASSSASCIPPVTETAQP